MSRLINADKLKNGRTLCKVFSNPTDEFYGMLQLIDEQPTVDAAKVVRCRDCKWNKERECPLSYTSPISVDGEVSIWYKNNDNDYCSYGERKDGAE